MHTTAFIGENGTERLTVDFGVKVRPHPEYPNLVHLCYDQIASARHNGHPIVRECRGVIVDVQTGDVVARPFDRFFNDGESHADPIDWASARVQDKLDGSLLVLWCYDQIWQVSTKGSPSASGSVGDNDLTFSELFWRTWVEQDLDTTPLDPTWTYMFELTSPLNRVVVAYEGDRLTLIGARENASGIEAPVLAFPALNPVRELPLGTLADVVAAAGELYPLNFEGFVVVDRHFNRVKIKSPKYVALHHIKDGFGVRRIIDLIKLGESNEVLTYFPEFRDLYDRVSQAMTAFVSGLESDYAAIQDITIQKEFALEAVKSRCSAALFKVRAGKAPTIWAAVCEFPADRIEDYLKISGSRTDTTPQGGAN